MVQKDERIPCVMFEDNSVELFHDFLSANKFMIAYLAKHAKKIVGTEYFGQNCKTVTFLTHDDHESFLTIHFKVVG